MQVATVCVLSVRTKKSEENDEGKETIIIQNLKTCAPYTSLTPSMSIYFLFLSINSY